MACGSCGGGRSNTEYLVRLPNGEERRVASQAEIRVLRAQNPPTEGQRALTWRAVDKINKAP